MAPKWLPIVLNFSKSIISVVSHILNVVKRYYI